ncbi:hypothetical protein RB594_009619 [Gaeumannomyces avenae]
MESPEPEPRMQVLHRIVCSNIDHRHDGEIFEDKPGFRKVDAMLHGKRPIMNLDRYISRNSEVSFIVFAEHHCAARGDRLSKSSGKPEKIRIISPSLYKALLRCARSRVFPDPDTATEMEAPYNFLYHHRQGLIAMAKDSDLGKAVLPLLEFLERNYAQHYDECERLISGGRITAAHLRKLFRPNQMVVCRKFGQSLDAFVLTGYPNLSPNKESLNFEGWEWTYDGAKLKRRPRMEAMHPLSDEETEIADLSIYPFESARPEDMRFLTERGKRFWEMMDMAFAAYTGWNFQRNFKYLQHRFVVNHATYRLIHDPSNEDGRQPGYSRLDLQTAHDSWPRISRDDDIPTAAASLLPAAVFEFDMG